MILLYDLDVEAQAFARSHNIKIRRTASFNTRPDFIAAMADIVSDAIDGHA
jgi:Ferrochelatase.